MRLIARNVGFTWDTAAAGAALSSFSGEFSAGIPQFICGPTGSGKTTLSLLLSGLLKPQTGEIIKAAHAAAQPGCTAYVFQFPERIFFADTVAQELDQIAGSDGAQRARLSLNALGIDFDGIAGLHPFHLSGGYGRIVALVMQMAREPDILIVDEPTIALDWQFHARVTALLRDWLSPARILVAVTHDLDFMRALPGQAWVLAAGGLAWTGATADLLNRDDLLQSYGLN